MRLPLCRTGAVAFNLSSSLRRRTACRQRAWLRLAILLVIASTNVDAERLPLALYSTSDGLAHNTINRIVRDSQGFLWFCTMDGLSRFDGYAFRTFDTSHGLPRAGINDLLETKQGDYWIATDNGLVHLDRRSGSTARSGSLTLDSGVAPALPLIVPLASDRRSRTITVLRQTAD